MRQWFSSHFTSSQRAHYTAHDSGGWRFLS